ncbi:tRNA pseudouridine(55) synthase TruB [bacterium]|nr:tRNA pseudouridine(55) synthase TruB [bacterium]
MNGAILVHKSSEISSHELVAQIKHLLNVSKAGHFGTLDPLATGLLIVGLNKATKLFPFVSKKVKVYKGQMKLGISTNTYDSLGKTISESQHPLPSSEKLIETMKKFEGEFDQIPPPYSAKKYKGKPLYKLARKNEPFELKSCKVTLHRFQLIHYSPPLLHFEVKCSSGTYIRSLVHDLGQELGSGAHLTELQRTQIGHFHIKNSLNLKQIEKFFQEGRIQDFIISLKDLLPEFPQIILSEHGVHWIQNGRLISGDKILKQISPPLERKREDIFQMCDVQGNLLALARKNSEKNHFHPFLVFK